MNYIDLLPNDISAYIYELAYLPYYNHFCDFLIKKYHFNLTVLNKYYRTHSLVYIFTTYTNKSVEQLYEVILLFNVKNKHNLSIQKSIFVINHLLKKI